MTPAERQALLRDRLDEVGIDAPAADPLQLRSAQRKRIGALAPGWPDTLPDRDMRRGWSR